MGGWSPSLVLEEKVETDCLVEEEEELCCRDTLLLLATSPSDQHTIDQILPLTTTRKYTRRRTNG
jgi:hypothetical protein